MDVEIGDLRLIRKKTKAGMLDCMKALSQTGGDSSAAELLLKEWGLAGVEQRADRAAREGRVFIHYSDAGAAMVELACETDFVSRGEAFLAAGERIAAIACAKRLADPDAEIDGLVSGLASILKENIAVRRVEYLQAGALERVYAYLHGDGRIGVLALARADSSAAFEDEGVAAFFHDLALHIAAFHPQFLEEAAVPDAYRLRKTEEFRAQIEEDESMARKSASIREGAVAGRLKKHLADVCLLGRGFVKDEKVPAEKVMRELGVRRGYRLSVAGFAYFGVGDGSGGEAGGEVAAG
jgi:elongation factor Ts